MKKLYRTDIVFRKARLILRQRRCDKTQAEEPATWKEYMKSHVLFARFIVTTESSIFPLSARLVIIASKLYDMLIGMN